MDPWVVPWSHHCVGLPCSRLPVGDDADVVAVHAGGDGGPCVLEHLPLLRGGVVHALKLVNLPPALGRGADDAVFVKFEATPTTAVVAAATEDANVPTQLLNLYTAGMSILVM